MLWCELKIPLYTILLLLMVSQTMSSAFQAVSFDGKCRHSNEIIEYLATKSIPHSKMKHLNIIDCAQRDGNFIVNKMFKTQFSNELGED